MRPRPGSLVAWWDGNSLSLAVVAGEEKGRIRLVLERGREARVTPARVAFEVERGSALGVGAEERRLAGERVASVRRRLLEMAGQVEIPLVWEIASEEPREGGGPATFETGDLAQLALDDGTPGARVALIWALLGDAIHFTRKGDVWEAREAEAVKELLRQRRRIEERERAKEELFSALREAASGNEYKPRDDETERRYLDALEKLAVHEEATNPSVKELALEVLEAAGARSDRPHAAAFRLLRLVGRFTDDDENLQLRRFNLRTAFTPALRDEARRAVARGPRPVERADLTGLRTVSIDSSHTREIDDGLSHEDLGGGACRLGVHIADPGAFVLLDDPLDQEALARGVTHYFPDGRLLMLPEEISEEAASLVESQRRPALSFLVDLDRDGELSDFAIRRSWVCCETRLDYESAERMIGGDDSSLEALLAGLRTVADARLAARMAAGGINIEAPEVDLFVDREGRVVLERIERESASRRMVSEAMILAGEVAARYCREAKIPAIFRRQGPPAGSIEVPAPGEWSPVSVRAVRRSLKRAEVSLSPGPHATLGLQAYIQVTSPLRRYQDLVMHRQIGAHIAGEAPPYDLEALQRIAASTERAEADARRAERAWNDYWLLRYLERTVGEEVEATVVDTAPRTIVRLDETLWEQPVPSLKGVEAGQRVRLRLERVNPRAGLLTLRKDP